MTRDLRHPGTALIVGLGLTGVSCARHLARRGWQLAITDSRPQPPGMEQLRQFAPAARVSVGRFDASLLGGADLVVASPGVALAEPIFAAARAQQIEIVGDVELFAREVQAPTVGITGTNGKSTVTTLLGRMAARGGIRVSVGGNLGTPALELLDAGQGSRPEMYVLELSSFQLETVSSLRLAAGAVLNLSADHMDRYPTMQHYAAAKARVFAHCDVAVINADDEWVAKMPRSDQRTLRFSLRADSAAQYQLLDSAHGPALARDRVPLLPVAEMKLTGTHNAANALAALALGDATGVPLQAMLEELREFAGLAHRSQWVAQIRGVRYVNDSKGTNVGATIAAVAGMSGALVVIAGGDGKGQDFSPLAAAFRGRVRHVVLIGRDAATIAEALLGVCPTETCASLPEAVVAAARVAQPGDTVLLSPACASLDMFRDYAHRGTVFTEAVQRLAS